MSDKRSVLLRRFRRRLPEELHWIGSTRVRELDDVLGVPLRERAAAQAAIDAFVERWPEPPAIDDDPDPEYTAPKDRGSATLADSLADALEDTGEDVDRLALWLASGSPWSDLGNHDDRAADCWRAALTDWAREGFPPPRYLDRELMDALVESYAGEVLRPAEAFASRLAALLDDGAPVQPCERDARLRGWHVRHFGETPRWWLERFHRHVLERRWWRGRRDRLGEDENAELLAEMVLQVYRTGAATAVDRHALVPLVQAFALGGVPDFDTLARADRV